MIEFVRCEYEWEEVSQWRCALVKDIETLSPSCVSLCHPDATRRTDSPRVSPVCTAFPKTAKSHNRCGLGPLIQGRETCATFSKVIQEAMKKDVLPREIGKCWDLSHEQQRNQWQSGEPHSILATISRALLSASSVKRQIIEHHYTLRVRRIGQSDI